MKKILFLGKHAKAFERQIDALLTTTNIYSFNDYSKDDVYDIIVVFEILEKNVKLKCKELVFLSGEPDTISTPNKAFLSQFDTIISTNRFIKGKSIIHKQFLNWHLGLFDNPQKHTKTYFENNSFLHKKKNDNAIVGISSAKRMTSGHGERFEFMNYAKFYFQDSLSLFGWGIQEFNDKIEFLQNYKYQIVIENSKIKDYWTEKLADSFLAECYTFYCGCPNIKEYFPENSFEIIDISKPFEAMNIIKEAVSNNYFEKYYQDILISKKKILNEYNIIQYITTLPIRSKIKTHHIKNKKQRFCKLISKMIKYCLPYGIIALYTKRNKKGK